METIWQIRLEPESTEIVIEEFKVVKETESQFHYDRKTGQALGRVNKVTVDGELGIMAGGKWYSTPEKAFTSWMLFHQREGAFHQTVADKSKKALERRIWE